jgi:hypothetical protein
MAATIAPRFFLPPYRGRGATRIESESGCPLSIWTMAATVGDSDAD